MSPAGPRRGVPDEVAVGRTGGADAPPATSREPTRTAPPGAIPAGPAGRDPDPEGGTGPAAAPVTGSGSAAAPSAPGRTADMAKPPVAAPGRRGRRRGARRGSRRGSRRHPPAPAPGTRRYLVLACGTEDVVGVDVAGGALVRLRVRWDEERAPDLAPFDLVDARLAPDPERDDLAHPEAVTVEGLPEAVGSMRGRRVRRLLRPLAAPTDGHLLGFPGTSWPYWEFRGMRPSVALVVPTRGPLLFRRRADESVWARFGWPRSDNWLPVEDRRAIAALWAGRRDRLSGKDLASALGFRPHYLLVVLSQPRQGHCYKQVAAFLPRP